MEKKKKTGGKKKVGRVRRWQLAIICQAEMCSRRAINTIRESKRAFSPAKSGVVLPMPMLYKRLF